MATIRKRGNTYQIRVSCGYDVNGNHKEQSMTWKPDESMTKRQIEKELNRQAATDEGRVIDSTLLFLLKAAKLILLTLSDKFISESFSQQLTECCSTISAFISILSIDLQKYIAETCIVFIVSGMEIVFILSQYTKEFSPIVVIPFSITTFSILFFIPSHGEHPNSKLYISPVPEIVKVLV